MTTTTLVYSVETTRALPSTAEANGTLTGVLKLVFPNESGKPNSVIIKEYIPLGWTLSSSSPPAGDFDSQLGEIRWLLYGDEVYSRNLTYVTRAAENATGTAEFTGQLLYNDQANNSVTLTIGGDTGVQVGYVADLDGDGEISDFELLAYIDLWVQKLVDDFGLLDAVDEWSS